MQAMRVCWYFKDFPLEILGSDRKQNTAKPMQDTLGPYTRVQYTCRCKIGCDTI